MAWRRTAKVVRAQDVFGRFGGDEFVLLLPCTPLADAMLVAQKVREAICADPVDVNGTSVGVSGLGGAA
jgi:diguanylate cyclase (GGDEF)-like protein